MLRYWPYRPVPERWLRGISSAELPIQDVSDEDPNLGGAVLMSKCLVVLS